jgi:hypothetical protein
MCWPILVIVKDSCFRVGLSQLSRGQGVVRDDRGLANHSHGRPLRIRPPSELARKGISTPLLATGPLILLLSRNTRDELHRSRSATKLNQVVAMMRTAAVGSTEPIPLYSGVQKAAQPKPDDKAVDSELPPDDAEVSPLASPEVAPHCAASRPLSTAVRPPIPAFALGLLSHPPSLVSHSVTPCLN